jgi:hypothetical protein
MMPLRALTILTVGLLLIAGSTSFVLAARQAPHRPASRSAIVSWGQALALADAKRPAASLIAFRAALRDTNIARSVWNIRLAYAGCLNDAAFEVIDRLGSKGPRQSVSARRIALLREAIAQLDTAETIASEPRAISIIRFEHGRLLELWGFPLDGYGWYRASLSADPNNADAAMGLIRTTQLLRGFTEGGP